MKKRFLSILLAVVMILPLLPTQALAASAAKFTDVPPESWFYDDVDFVTRNGYYKGVTSGTFDPDGAMTRAMLATVLARYAKADVDNGVSAFPDVPVGHMVHRGCHLGAAKRDRRGLRRSLQARRPDNPPGNGRCFRKIRYIL